MRLLGRDSACGEHGLGHVEVRLGPGVDAAQRVAGMDGFAGFDQAVETDGEVHAIAGFGPSGAELQRGLTDQSGIDLLHLASGWRGNLANDWRLVDLRHARQIRRVSALGGDNFIKLPPGAAIVETFLQRLTRDRGDFFRQIEHERAQIRRAAAFEAFEGFDDLQCVADGASGGFRHGIQNGENLDAHFAADGDHAGGERFGFVLRLHEGAAAEFHIEHQAVERLGEFFGHDRGGDQRDGRHGAGDVAQGVQFAVGRAEALGLTHHGDADLPELGGGLPESEVNVETGDRFEFVERAAGDAQTAAGNHRHPATGAGHQRREHQ
ncbi:MAG: hypothetical protein MUC40_00295 [Akkermansiaceae bacterium]|nr:hypothetical protein [Akkermansiaceae bacterium]